MKQLFTTFAVFITLISFSQDKILLKDRKDTIYCKIKSVTASNIFYIEKGEHKSEYMNNVAYHSPISSNAPVANSNAIKKDSSIIQLPIDSVTGLISYTVIENVDGQSKSQLYNKAREWFVNTYKDANAVIQLDDKDAGKLMGKGVYKYAFANGINISQITLTFTVNIDIKDGKYRCRIYAFSGDNANTSMLGGPNATNIYKIDYDRCYTDLKAGKREKYNSKMLNGLDSEVKSIEKSLRDAMNKKVTGEW